MLSGASACVELKEFEQAVTWCEKGLAVSFVVTLTCVPSYIFLVDTKQLFASSNFIGSV